MANQIITIRKAELTDAKLLAELGRTCFAETFERMNTPENMQNYLDGAFSEEIQTRELLADESTFLIIICDGELSGYAHLQGGNKEDCVSGQRPIELIRFYMASRWIGKGLARHLMEACLDEARRNAYDVIWLGVWKENPRAIAFYQKSGFQPVGEHKFILGEDVQEDLIMAQLL